MQKLDYLFLYEHAQRELLSILLVSKELLNKGYTVGIASVKDVHCVSREVIVTILSVPFLSLEPYREYVMPFVKNNKFLKIVNRYEEQLWAEDQIKNYVLADEYSRAGYYLCWGNQSKEILLNRGGNPKDMWVVGCPRYDPLILLKDKKEIIREKLNVPNGFEKTVLLATNFGGMFPQNSNGLNDKASVCRAEFYEELETYIAQYPNVLFYIRPHPSEIIANSQYAYSFKKYNNFFCSNEGTSAEAVLISDVVGTWTSTVAVEAWILKKPSFGFMGMRAYEVWPDYVITKLHFYYNYMDIEPELNKNMAENAISSNNSMDMKRQNFINYTYGLCDGNSTILATKAYEEIYNRSLKEALSLKLRRYAYPKELIRNFMVRQMKLWWVYKPWIENRTDIMKFDIRKYINNNQFILEDNLDDLKIY